MDGFKIICNKCGKESIVQQCDDYVDIKGNIEVDYYDRYFSNNRISFVCDCGNRVEDR
jgi:hypothetical protein